MEAADAADEGAGLGDDEVLELVGELRWELVDGVRKNQGTSGDVGCSNSNYP